MNNELPRNIKDIPYKHAYDGKKIWTILGQNKRLVGSLTLQNDDALLMFKLPRDEVDKYKGKRVKSVTAVDTGSSRITFLDSSLWESPMSSFFNRNGEADMRLRPSLVVVQPNSKDSIDKVKNLSAYLPGVGEWLKEDFLDFDMEEYKFKQTKRIYHPIPLPGIATIKLYSKLTIDIDSLYMDKKFIAYPESYVTIEFEEARNIESAVNIFTYVENFFNFICLTPHSTNVFTSDISKKKDKYRKTLYILNPSGHKNYQREEMRNDKDLLFNFNDISDINGVFKKWITQYRRIEEIVQALTLLRSTNVSEDMRFTTIINALEAVHRRYYDSKTMSDDDYSKKVKEITDQIQHTTDKDFVSGKLQYGNEMSLRKRLKNVCAIGVKHGIDEPSKDLQNRIIGTRNYLTHGDESRKKDALRPYELHTANALLGRYLKLLLLQILGVNEEELTNIVSSSGQFNQYFRDEPAVPNKYF